jgi:hypothetical protein
MVQIPLRRAHRLRAITLASPTKKLRPQPTERAPTAWHTNDEYTNAEASEEASASSAVANVSENRVLPILTSSPIVKPTLLLSPFSWAVSNSCHRDRIARPHTAMPRRARPRYPLSAKAGSGNARWRAEGRVTGDRRIRPPADSVMNSPLCRIRAERPRPISYRLPEGFLHCKNHRHQSTCKIHKS